MTRTVGTARLVVAGIVLMGGAIGMFGDVQMASVNQVFPRVPRTEQEQVAGLQKDGEAPAARHDLSLVARGRSRDGDPCIPIAPVTFSARVAVVC